MSIQSSISLRVEEDLRKLLTEIANPHSLLTQEDVKFGLAAFGVQEKDRTILAEKWANEMLK